MGHMKYLHTMVRVTDVEASLRFYRDALGLELLSRRDFPQGRFTLIFLAAPGDASAQIWSTSSSTDATVGAWPMPSTRWFPPPAH